MVIMFSAKFTISDSDSHRVIMLWFFIAWGVGGEELGELGWWDVVAAGVNVTEFDLNIKFSLPFIHSFFELFFSGLSFFILLFEESSGFEFISR